MPGLIFDVRGRRFGRLRIPGGAEPVMRGQHTYWPAVCDCGNQVLVRGARVRAGRTRSCGCYRVDPEARQATRLDEIKAERRPAIARAPRNSDVH